jgi:hypothetical protein
MRGLRGGVSVALVLALLLAACSGVPAATPGPSAAPSAAADPSADASLDPAIASAISQRKQFGLRSDLAWVLAVAANPRARIGMLDFLMLPEEEAEFGQRQSDYDTVIAAVLAHAVGRENVFGGLYIDQASHTVVALWTTDPLLHRIAILAQLGTSGPLATRQVKYSEKQLRDLQDRVSSDVDWMRGIRAQAMGVGADIMANATSLTISSANAAAPGIIRTHYGVPADMLKIDSDGTGIMLQPRGTIEGTVRTSDGKAPGENGLDLRWKPDIADGRDCGSGVGLGVTPAGTFTLPCAPGGWTIWLAAALADGWTDVGSAHVVVPPGGTVKLLIALKPGAVLGP